MLQVIYFDFIEFCHIQSSYHIVFNNFCPSQFQDPQGGPCSQKWVQKWEGKLMLVQKNLPKILGYSVPNVPVQRFSFHNTWYLKEIFI